MVSMPVSVAPHQSVFQLNGEQFSIVPMTVADLPDVCAIENTIYAFPWTKGNFIDSLTSGYSGAIVRIAGEKDLSPCRSSVIADSMTMKLPYEVHLLNLSVAKPFQSKGIGTAYLHTLINDARSQGGEAMLLEVRPSNFAAIKLYKSLGFSQVGVRKGYYRSLNNEREDALVFSLAFSTSTKP
jgi:[ribosomal protein S18]-alanine N-acetyltransferase